MSERLVGSPGAWLCVSAVVTAAAGGECRANLLVNPSFETNSGAGQRSAVDTTSLPGWRVAANTIDVVSFWQAADGLFSIDLTGTSLGRLEQDFATLPGSLYEVRFAMAANTNQTPPGIYSLRVSAAGQQQQFDFNRTASLSITNMGYVEQVWQFTAVSPLSTLAFTSLTNTFNGGPVIDNVRVEVVPAPGTALCVLALPFLQTYRRRRPA